MRLPSTSDRLATRERPTGHPVMKQRWSRILFLHWQVDPALLQVLLPPGLHLDLHEGKAWLGIVPFYMERIRPVYLPPVPGVSWFLELNVRTYVHDDAGVPGVWFFSLDCNQPLAVELARRAFHLPYQHARMSCRSLGSVTEYDCRRRSMDATARYRYGPVGPASEAAPGTLEFFLAERYVLYSSGADGSLHEGRVHHAPYRVAPAHCDPWSTLPAMWNGLPTIEGPPRSVLWAGQVDVDVFALKKLRTPVS
ncbi:YqjF family protein [Luteolibacter marinus]|uniref:YqjF family protein n=1 Tax=Luteolibacter marinus TaxID=2776705 RepID=UPI001867038A|nr:DUF2071 domain-containing protein [Luteolibacter marinus]